VAGVRQQILKALLVLNIGRYYKNPYKNPLIVYQYLGMTKIAGALNMLHKIILRHNIINPSTEEAIKIYQTDRNYLNFYRNFLIESDNGRSSLRIANTFSLKVVSMA
jgi:hypothetical protein